MLFNDVSAPQLCRFTAYINLYFGVPVYCQFALRYVNTASSSMSRETGSVAEQPSPQCSTAVHQNIFVIRGTGLANLLTMYSVIRRDALTRRFQLW